MKVQDSLEVLSDRERAENCFKGLRKFLMEEASAAECDHFLQHTLRVIVYHALQIEYLRPVNGIKICKQQQGNTIYCAININIISYHQQGSRFKCAINIL